MASCLQLADAQPLDLAAYERVWWDAVHQVAHAIFGYGS